MSKKHKLDGIDRLPILQPCPLSDHLQIFQPCPLSDILRNGQCGLRNCKVFNTIYVGTFYTKLLGDVIGNDACNSLLDNTMKGPSQWAEKLFRAVQYLLAQCKQ